MKLHIFHGGATDVGRIRDENQDSILMLPEFSTYVVCDGMGGNQGGAVASTVAAQAIEASLTENPCNEEECLRTPENWRYFAESVFLAANGSILKKAHEMPELQGMGSTGVMLQILGNKANICYLGDSRTYLFRQGKLYTLTIDHSYNNDRILLGEHVNLEERRKNTHAISRALGVRETIFPDYIFLNIKPNDIFVLCSDGLHGMIGSVEIAEQLSTTFQNGLLQSKGLLEEDLQKICADSAQNLVNAANEAGGADNVTAAVVLVTNGEEVTYSPQKVKGDLVFSIQLPRDISATEEASCLVIEKNSSFGVVHGPTHVKDLPQLLGTPGFRFALSQIALEFECPIYLRDRIVLPDLFKRIGLGTDVFQRFGVTGKLDEPPSGPDLRFTIDDSPTQIDGKAARAEQAAHKKAQDEAEAPVKVEKSIPQQSLERLAATEARPVPLLENINRGRAAPGDDELPQVTPPDMEPVRTTLVSEVQVSLADAGDTITHPLKRVDSLGTEAAKTQEAAAPIFVIELQAKPPVHEVSAPVSQEVRPPKVPPLQPPAEPVQTTGSSKEGKISREPESRDAKLPPQLAALRETKMQPVGVPKELRAPPKPPQPQTAEQHVRSGNAQPMRPGEERPHRQNANAPMGVRAPMPPMRAGPHAPHLDQRMMHPPRSESRTGTFTRYVVLTMLMLAGFATYMVAANPQIFTTVLRSFKTLSPKQK
jgi:serine/threonine protein phosphatase PrpC